MLAAPASHSTRFRPCNTTRPLPFHGYWSLIYHVGGDKCAKHQMSVVARGLNHFMWDKTMTVWNTDKFVSLRATLTCLLAARNLTQDYLQSPEQDSVFIKLDGIFLHTHYLPNRGALGSWQRIAFTGLLVVPRLFKNRMIVLALSCCGSSSLSRD